MVYEAPGSGKLPQGDRTVNRPGHLADRCAVDRIRVPATVCAIGPGLVGGITTGSVSGCLIFLATTGALAVTRYVRPSRCEDDCPGAGGWSGLAGTWLRTAHSTFRDSDV